MYISFSVWILLRLTMRHLQTVRSEVFLCIFALVI